MQFTLPITSSASAGKGNLYRWVNPIASSATTGISGWAATAANTYVGVIGQPSNPRCLRFSATPSWNGGMHMKKIGQLARPLGRKLNA